MCWNDALKMKYDLIFKFGELLQIFCVDTMLIPIKCSVSVTSIIGIIFPKNIISVSVGKNVNIYSGTQYTSLT